MLFDTNPKRIKNKYGPKKFITRGMFAKILKGSLEELISSQSKYSYSKKVHLYLIAHPKK